MQTESKSEFVDITVYHDKLEVRMTAAINHA